jgi:hypothetical protein
MVQPTDRLMTQFEIDAAARTRVEYEGRQSIFDL